MSFWEAQEAMQQKRKEIKKNVLMKIDATLLPLYLTLGTQNSISTGALLIDEKVCSVVAGMGTQALRGRP
jgi:hypothetical protein